MARFGEYRKACRASSAQANESRLSLRFVHSPAFAQNLNRYRFVARERPLPDGTTPPPAADSNRAVRTGGVGGGGVGGGVDDSINTFSGGNVFLKAVVSAVSAQRPLGGSGQGGISLLLPPKAQKSSAGKRGGSVGGQRALSGLIHSGRKGAADMVIRSQEVVRQLAGGVRKVGARRAGATSRVRSSGGGGGGDEDANAWFYNMFGGGGGRQSWRGLGAGVNRLPIAGH